MNYNDIKDEWKRSRWCNRHCRIIVAGINECQANLEKIKSIDIGGDIEQLKEIHYQCEKLLENVERTNWYNDYAFSNYDEIYNFFEEKILSIKRSVVDYANYINNKIETITELQKQEEIAIRNSPFTANIKNPPQSPADGSLSYSQKNQWVRQQLYHDNPTLYEDRSFYENTSEDLFDRISKCIKNYEEHYGEMPSIDMISDILGVPENTISEVMNEMNIGKISR